MSNAFMRVLVFFDLPTKKKKHRKIYARFRKFLLNDGYDMLQFSVYMRLCKGLDGVNKHIQRLEMNIPEKGSVRAMIVTENQYEKMRILVGNPIKNEDISIPNQLVLF